MPSNPHYSLHIQASHALSLGFIFHARNWLYTDKAKACESALNWMHFDNTETLESVLNWLYYDNPEALESLLIWLYFDNPEALESTLYGISHKPTSNINLITSIIIINTCYRHESMNPWSQRNWWIYNLPVSPNYIVCFMDATCYTSCNCHKTCSCCHVITV